MADKPMVVAIIPARGGSKGLSGKNIRDLAGTPLLAYSIRTAQAAAGVDRVVVSTDEPAIARVAERYGAEVPFLRPRELATDQAGLLGVARHCMHQLFGKVRPDVITLLLLPTSPFRKPSLLERMIGKLRERRHRVMTVRRVEIDREGVFLPAGDGRLDMLLPNVRCTVSGRALAYYRPYGLISGSWGDPSWPSYVERVEDPISLIDIDTMEDFLLAEKVIERGLFDFEVGTPC